VRVPCPCNGYYVVIRYYRRSKKSSKIDTCHILDGSRSKIMQPITFKKQQWLLNWVYFIPSCRVEVRQWLFLVPILTFFPQFECNVIIKFYTRPNVNTIKIILFSLKNHWEITVRVWSFKLLLFEDPEALHCQFIVTIQLSLDLFLNQCVLSSQNISIAQFGCWRGSWPVSQNFLLAANVDTQLSFSCKQIFLDLSKI